MLPNAGLCPVTERTILKGLVEPAVIVIDRAIRDFLEPENESLDGLDRKWQQLLTASVLPPSPDTFLEFSTTFGMDAPRTLGLLIQIVDLWGDEYRLEQGGRPAFEARRTIRQRIRQVCAEREDHDEIMAWWTVLTEMVRHDFVGSHEGDAPSARSRAGRRLVNACIEEQRERARWWFQSTPFVEKHDGTINGPPFQWSTILDPEGVLLRSTSGFGSVLATQILAPDAPDCSMNDLSGEMMSHLLQPGLLALARINRKSAHLVKREPTDGEQSLHEIDGGQQPLVAYLEVDGGLDFAFDNDAVVESVEEEAWPEVIDG